jgi:hypothetical protein
MPKQYGPRIGNVTWTHDDDTLRDESGRPVVFVDEAWLQGVLDGSHAAETPEKASYDKGFKAGQAGFKAMERQRDELEAKYIREVAAHRQNCNLLNEKMNEWGRFKRENEALISELRRVREQRDALIQDVRHATDRAVKAERAAKDMADGFMLLHNVAKEWCPKA